MQNVRTLQLKWKETHQQQVRLNKRIIFQVYFVFFVKIKATMVSSIAMKLVVYQFRQFRSFKKLEQLQTDFVFI